MKDQTVIQLYSFVIDGQLFAVPAASIKEVRDRREVTTITPIFHAPPSVRGYINVRGEINLVLDLRRLLGRPERQGDGSDLIFFQESVGPSFGVLVDQTGEIFNVVPERLEEWNSAPGDNNSGNSAQSRFTTSVYKADETLISVLDPARFLVR